MSKDKETPSATGKPAPRRAQRYNSPRLKFDVTAEHIARGVRGDSSRCMIAQALSDAYPEYTGAAADLQTIRFSDPTRQLRFTYLTPREAAFAIVEFDEGIEPEPFTVLLRRASQITRNSQWGSVKGPRVPTDPSEPPAQMGVGEKPKPFSPTHPKEPPLGSRRAQGNGGRSIPTIIGGQPLPYGVLLGRASGTKHKGTGSFYAPGNLAKRRVFGLRMLRAGRAALLAQLAAKERDGQ